MVKKALLFLAILFLVLIAGIIFFGKYTGIDDIWLSIIQIVLHVGGVAAFAGYCAAGNRTDGDLVAGAEDEDGLVFALTTPVEELVKKDVVIFKVVKEER